MLLRGCIDLDLAHNPPPDLAIEVEISRSAVDKLAIYADLGVSEVWFYNGESLRMYMLQSDGTKWEPNGNSRLTSLRGPVKIGLTGQSYPPSRDDSFA